MTDATGGPWSGCEDGPVALLDWDNSLRPGFTLSDALDAQHDPQANRASHAWKRLLESYGRSVRLALSAEERAGLYDRLVIDAEDLWVGLMAGRDVGDYLGSARATARRTGLRPGAKELVQAIRRVGWRPVLVSGAPIEFLHVTAEALRISPADVVGWQLAETDGVFEGRLEQGNTARLSVKRAEIERRTWNNVVALGLGDSAADTPIVCRALIQAWVDPGLDTQESERVTWTRQVFDSKTRRGSLSDLAADVMAWNKDPTADFGPSA